MNSLGRKVRTSNRDKRATDPLDRLIFEKGLRIRHLLIDKGIDLMVLVLSNGSILKSKLSDFPRLHKATKKQLDDWEMISEGVGIEWPDLDEDLSLKGFVKTAYMNRAIQALSGSQETILS